MYKPLREKESQVFVIHNGDGKNGFLEKINEPTDWRITEGFGYQKLCAIWFSSSLNHSSKDFIIHIKLENQRITYVKFTIYHYSSITSVDSYTKGYGTHNIRNTRKLSLNFFLQLSGYFSWCIFNYTGNEIRLTV